MVSAGCFSLLALSLVANVLLFRSAKSSYSRLCANRLDPLGLTSIEAVASARSGPLLVVLGDSRARAWPPPLDLEGQLTVYNGGVGGQTSAQVLGRFERQLESLSPDLVLLQVGINDLKTLGIFPDRSVSIVAACKQNIEAIVQTAVEGHAQVILTTIFPPGPVPLLRRPFWSDEIAPAIEDVNGLIRSMASDRVTIFDIEAILTDEGGALVDAFARDFLHLNDAGYAALDSRLSVLLSRLLRIDASA